MAFKNLRVEVAELFGETASVVRFDPADEFGAAYYQRKRTAKSNDHKRAHRKAEDTLNARLERKRARQLAEQKLRVVVNHPISCVMCRVPFATRESLAAHWWAKHPEQHRAESDRRTVEQLRRQLDRVTERLAPLELERDRLREAIRRFGG